MNLNDTSFLGLKTQQSPIAEVIVKPEQPKQIVNQAPLQQIPEKKPLFGQTIPQQQILVPKPQPTQANLAIQSIKPPLPQAVQPVKAPLTASPSFNQIQKPATTSTPVGQFAFNTAGSPASFSGFGAKQTETGGQQQPAIQKNLFPSKPSVTTVPSDQSSKLGQSTSLFNVAPKSDVQQPFSFGKIFV